MTVSQETATTVSTYPGFLTTSRSSGALNECRSPLGRQSHNASSAYIRDLIDRTLEGSANSSTNLKLSYYAVPVAVSAEPAARASVPDMSEEGLLSHAVIDDLCWAPTRRVRKVKVKVTRVIRRRQWAIDDEDIPL